MLIRRGEIYFADLSPVVGSEQGYQAALIIQNDIGTSTAHYIVAAITSHIEKSRLPTHIEKCLLTPGGLEKFGHSSGANQDY